MRADWWDVWVWESGCRSVGLKYVERERGRGGCGNCGRRGVGVVKRGARCNKVRERAEAICLGAWNWGPGRNV